ncbi:GIY-YIG nuclease family protein [Desulfoscipio geothermicus]|uniref:DUF4357 domain-containing protein n=1 Tax=Desulfoscipio geothermicus DSM 3669 TaxID=1121426 RepID=A0A1I6D561_9FIRM|nr:GIY-YIG nuclease family protein [Desulfoscipio geothermicus]SFR00598.1 protein of unknown function [Desulfoscipio geothermicus DSM 3669]
MSGKLIRLFLVDGKPEGMKTVEISNMTILGTIFPRTALDMFSKRDAASRPGVYMLLGPDVNEANQSILYIGEGDPVLPRLKSHAGKKDFWTYAIVFTSKDDYLTKTQIKYLEAEIYTLAKTAHRAKLDNTQEPTHPNISEVDRAEVNHFMVAIKLILSALGIDILEPRTSNETIGITDREIYELTVKNAKAQMAIIDNKYVVLKGSTAVAKERKSAPPSIIKLRQDLIDAEIMVPNDEGTFIFQKDANFNSPSYAAAAIVGGSANGQIMWKFNGKSLKELEREKNKEEEPIED